MKVEIRVHKDFQVLDIKLDPKDHVEMNVSMAWRSVTFFEPSDQFLNDLIQECQIELRRRAGDIPDDVTK